MSFYHAFEGIWTAIRTEVHLRFHLAVANLIVLFAVCYGIDRVQWAVLVLSCAAVISAELINTALERAVDTATRERSYTAKLAKDAAAGAVLVSALGAVLVGVCLFGDTAKIGETLVHIFTTPKILIIGIVLGIFDVLFIVFGGKNGKEI